MSRKDDLDRFYRLLDDLEHQVSGKQKLKDCTGYMDWPDRGVYFFLANHERRESGDHPRLTRVGTHAVSEGSGTTLWERLRNHRGNNRGAYEGGGNHRGSVFRERVGEAIIEREGLNDEYPKWSVGSSAGRDLRLDELDMERRVSEYIRDLPFLWIAVDDKPGPNSDRAYIERNAIALVSNFQKESIDSRAKDWLGEHSPSRKIRHSGLWNVNHVDEEYDAMFLDRLEEAVQETQPP